MLWKRRIWPVWARTVGGMIRQGAVVRVHCRQCATFFDVDLAGISRARGDDHSVVDGSTSCRITSCRGRGYFLAAASMEETFLLLVNANMVQREALEQLRPVDIEPPTSGAPPPARAESLRRIAA